MLNGREKGYASDHPTSSLSNLVAAFPAYAAYSATKFAVRAMTQSAGKIDSL